MRILRTVEKVETDPYQVLELPYGATLEEVKSAWRAKARTLHPDANPADQAGAAQQFARAKEAYEALMKILAAASAAPAPEQEKSEKPQETDPYAAWPVHDPFLAWPGPTRRGDNLKVAAQVPLEAALFGGSVTVPLEYKVPCASCAGTGIKGCAVCKGDGFQLMRAKFETKVPPGSQDGAKVRLPRRGGPGWGGQAAGDLEIVFRVKDKVWKASGKDLFASLRVTTANCLSGVTVTVPRPGRDVTVTVPPGSLEGYEETIQGAGIGGDATVKISPSPLDLSNARVLSALAALDVAERASRKASS